LTPERLAASQDRADAAYLSARLDVVGARVRRALAARGDATAAAEAGPAGDAVNDAAGAAVHDAAHETPHDTVEARLAAAEAVADRAEAAGARPRLRALAAAFGLGAADLDLLLVALAPEVDPGFGQLFGYLNDDYLNDDAACQRATAGLALELCGAGPLERIHRSRLAPGAALRASGLITVTDDDRPFPARTLRVADRVASHLLGDDRLDPALAEIARVLPAARCPPTGGEAQAALDRLASCLASDAAAGRPTYVRGARDSAVEDMAAKAACIAVARPHGLGEGAALHVDLARVPGGADARQLLAAAATEARLRGCALVAGPVENLPPETADRARILRAAFGLPVPAVLTGAAAWDARWSETLPLLFDVPAPGRRERGAWWAQALGDLSVSGGSHDAAQALAQYRLSPRRIRGTVAAVAAQAAAEQHAITADGLLRTARLHNAAELERLARRVEPSARWDDLVLADQPADQLRELADRYRHRDTVLAEWRLRPGHGRGRGVAALFTGESGTGKTLAAEVLAAESGVDLYVVDLATVVDKYIGETEKNLERIFAAAADAQGMVFFDEADALFGKRSKVTDAHDRFANIETAYLLQRLETFDGLAVLATNLSGNVDPAFLRRFDAIIQFPRPGEAQRARLWDLSLGPGVPRAAGLDLAAVAAAFDLTGGTIRACALTAAYRAARTGRPITAADLFAAVRAEYHKLGRFIDEGEFSVSPP
jgi:hypothetical protein